MSSRMPEQPQTYANHVHRPTAWLITWFVGLVVFVVLIFHAYQEPTYVSFTLVVLAGVVLTAVTLIRLYALRLQNRIIRLEMQVRLSRFGREQDLARLALPQIVALRFAADAELPALINRAIAENLTPDAIKRAVTDWQGDRLRT